MGSYDALLGHRLDEPEIDELLTDEGVGVLSMADAGVPYGIPISFGYDGRGRLYFGFAGHSEEGRKVTYAQRSDVVSFLAYDVASQGEWRSVIVAGSLDRVGPDEWDRAKEAMADNAFAGELLADVDRRDNPRIWVLEADEMTGRGVGRE